MQIFLGGIDHESHRVQITQYLDGDRGWVLKTTSKSRPFLTLDIDLSAAKKAKNGYPRYVKD